ncbi:MAG: MCE family protein [Flavobacteriales bacterium]|nr:MCE family protein [Flavobacteriales bacterium]
MKITKEVKVGVVSMFAIALLVWGYNFLKGTNLLYKSKTVYTVYPSVAGLAKSSPILINGFQVGVVESIYFHHDQTGKVVVELLITENDFLIPNNSIASLISMDFLGSKAIALKVGNSATELQSGDTLIADLEKSMFDDVGEQLLPIKEKAENFLTGMDSTMADLKLVIQDLDDVFNDRNKRKISEILTNLNTTIVAYHEVATTMDATVKSMRPTLKNLKTFSDSLAALEMAETMKKAEATFQQMSEVMEKINKGEGSLGLLVNNDSLYYNLESTSKNMDKLMIDMKEHPKRYVHFSLFGRKDKD